VIPYQKYVLDNGLTVVLHEDKSDPLVHVDVTYHVGSAREEIGKSGFAHFFEHMMFQGSEHVGDEEHFKIVTESGGTMNGTTNTDRTNYFQTVPSNQLEKILWLEADRMGFLLDAVTQEKFEVQRETVKNERGQRVDNRPYGRLYERVSQAMYPQGHPYSWTTIGDIEDLNRVNVNDLKAFFLRWYGPNNATITIGGDIDTEQTLNWMKKYFGSIPKGPEVVDAELPLVSLKENRYISMEDNVHLPLIYISYPTVKANHKDEAALDLLTSILGEGKDSLLYKNLVKNQIAVQATTTHYCSELSCMFSLLALPHPASGKSLTDIETVINNTLLEFEKRGVEPDDLIKAKAKVESSSIFGLQSVRGKVTQLAYYQTFQDNPNGIEHEIARYNAVTKEDVMRVYNQYIKNSGAVIMSIVPNGKPEMIAAEDNFKAPVKKIVEQSEISSDDLVLRIAKDDFDRSKMPEASVSKAVDVPPMWKDGLKNGIRVLGTQSTETPTTAIMIKIPAGHYYEQKEKSGLSSMMADMLNESTLVRSGEEMSKELQKLGSSVRVSSSFDSLTINVNTLTKNLDQTLALMKEKMFQPAFKEEDFTRVKKNNIEGVKNAKKNAGYLSRIAIRQLLNKDNIASYSGSGDEQTLANVDLKDVKSFYEKHFMPSAGQVIVVSDLNQSEVMKRVNMLSDWKGESRKLELELPMPDTKTGVIYLVHKDDSPQSSIRIGKRAMTHDITGEYYKSYLMNFPLGGAFNSRINLNLREDKGYTYGARSGFNADEYSGTYTASAEVRGDVTDKSIVEFIKEISTYAESGITDEELTFMKSAINQRDALKYETPGAKLGFLAQILEYDLSPDFVKERNQIVENITAKEINELAKKHLNVKEMVIVVVGDSEVLRPQLKALGYEVVDYEI
ncbi:MAG: insulinase family protein, partial [Gammaproteobacteria bacterium]|nr:insulinase family protein [Gammaproteobacteria bacterium]